MNRPTDTSTNEVSVPAPLHLTSATQTLPTSATLAVHEMVARRRREGHETIHLGFGEAVFPLHPLLKKALAEAATRTGYAPVLGIAPLRQAIAAYLARMRGMTYSSDQIVIGPGSKPLLYALLHVLDGDVLLPVPSWVSYVPMVHLVGRRVIDVPTDVADHHRLTPQVLAQVLTQARREGANPRILIVNTPSNPTGSMFDRVDAEAVALWARETGITLISDEIYAELAHGWRKHVSPALFYPEGTIVTGGLSKTFSTGGWRLGYAVLPPETVGNEVMAATRALASEIWSTTAAPIQEAAIAAFKANDSIDRYVYRSALVHGYIAGQLFQTLTQLRVTCPRPAGGFYLYPDFSPWRPALLKLGVRTSQELADYLLEEWDIATLPGSVFNDDPHALRLRFSTSLLCEPERAASSEERDTFLWNLLDQAEALQPTEGERQLTPSLPILERTQARLTEMLQKIETYR